MNKRDFLNDFEICTILAALRLLQDETDGDDRRDMVHFEDYGAPPDDEFINNLCEKLNTGYVAPCQYDTQPPKKAPAARIHCIECRFCEEGIEVGGIDGVIRRECRRVPPVFAGDHRLGRWPAVRSDFWCGEAQPKEDAR